MNKENIKKVLQMLHKLYQYKSYLSIKGFVSGQLNNLTNEIDDAVRRYKSQYSDGDIEMVETKFGDDDIGIGPDEQDEIIELLILNPRERRRFCGIFPIWKGYRLELIACLREIAGRLEKSDKNLKNVDMAASGAGLSAGLIKLANMVSSTPLPAGLGTAASVLSAANGIMRAFTSAKREMNLESLLEESAEVVRRDKRQFEAMMRWFEYNVKLMDSVKTAIGSELHKLIFVKIKAIYDKARLANPSVTKNCKIVFDAIMEFLIKEGVQAHLAIPLAAASLKLFFILSSALLTLDWRDAALHVSRIANYGRATLYVGHAAAAVNNIFNPNTSFSNGVFPYIGVVLDLGPAILDLAGSTKKGVSNEQASNICKIACTMEEEIGRIEYVYTAFNSR